MGCSFDPSNQAKATQKGRPDPAAVTKLVQADPINCNNHQDNAMDCSFDPKLRGKTNAT